MSNICSISPLKMNLKSLAILSFFIKFDTSNQQGMFKGGKNLPLGNQMNFLWCKLVWVSEYYCSLASLALSTMQKRNGKVLNKLLHCHFFLNLFLTNIKFLVTLSVK